jgi:hypothetical protein
MNQKPQVFTHSIKSAVILAVAAGVDYNPNLPSSHPNNRCATQEDDLSWKSWLSGKSRSGQFHFVDLLELLHGHQRKPVDDMAPANSNNGF